MLKILISSFIIFTSFNLSADFKNSNGKALEKSLGQMLEWMGSDIEPEITKIKLSNQWESIDLLNDDNYVIWIGHSTFLIKKSGVTILTDPIFSERASPLKSFGPKRLIPPALQITDIPNIDFVTVSHNHYDHLDTRSLKEISALHPNAIFLVPSGDLKLLKKNKINNVSLTIENQGDIVCLLGPSGIGKTTILRTIAGLEKNNSGTITLKDRILSSKEIQVEPEDRNIALSFQDNSLFPHYTIIENINFGSKRNRDVKYDFNVNELIKVLHLEDFIENITTKPRAIFGLENYSIKEKNKAEITLFNPKYNYTFTKKHILSTSKNSPFLNKELKGKAYGIYANSQLILK